ncbi:DNA recombination protein RmuC [Pedobacter sp. AW1-32]|uniref:DNA recombination protein RmuC n=1 Tax=Pedobacter sp. AW1-32 TaxID=3383026 RepID=UPI003FEE4BF1
MEITTLIAGFFAGVTIAYIIFYLFNKTKSVSKTEFDSLTLRHNDVVGNLRLFEDKVQTLQASNELLTQKINLKDAELIQYQTKNASLETELKNSELKTVELVEKLNHESELSKSQQSEINLRLQQISELKANTDSYINSLAKEQEINQKQTKHAEEQILKITEQTSEVSKLSANNAALMDNVVKLTNVNDKQLKQIELFTLTINEHISEISKLTANNEALSDKLSMQKAEIEELQKTAHLQFEKIANRLFDEKSTKFTETNKTNLEALLNPLKDDIGKFKAKVEETHSEDTKQRVSLDERIRGLIDQTNKVSAEASNLATALKGKPQKRGNWGEMILERILEMSGLTKDREYFIQGGIKDDEGNMLRPDVRISLPDQRMIIIDSKVSLIAYDNYSATENPEEQKIHLNKHLEATYNHIEQLSNKNYDSLGSTLDFTMMFIPIEPAYMLAIQADLSIWAKAYEKRILLVSPTNLIACLKLFSDLWKRDYQSKNASEIVKKGEALYEKFVGFTKTFEDIGDSIKTTQDRYDKAMGQLKVGRGNIIKQGIELRNLGLKSDKKVSEKLLPSDMEELVLGREEEIDN